MDPYDTVAVRRVWQRVRQSMPETGASDAGVLAELIRHELAARQAYRRLATMAGRNAPLFRTLAAQEDGHARRLSALYDLLYGPLPQIAAPRMAGSGSFQEGLRAAYAAELQSAARYVQAAERWPDHREFFLDLAVQERRHAARLRELRAQHMR